MRVVFLALSRTLSAGSPARISSASLVESVLARDMFQMAKALRSKAMRD